MVIARHPGRPDLLLVKRAARREPGGWWLSADNLPAGAADSRTFGVVPDGLIEGRVLFRYRRFKDRPAGPARMGEEPPPPEPGGGPPPDRQAITGGAAPAAPFPDAG